MSGQLDFEDLVTPITEDQAFATFMTAARGLGLPVDSWATGGIARTILRVVAITYAMFSLLVATAIGGLFLERSTGGWLSLLARFVYGVDRILATFATGSLTLVNGGGGTFTYAPRQAIFQDEDTDKTFTNVNAFTLNPSATLTIDIIATEAGSASSSLPTKITKLVTQMLRVTCSNASALVGRDEELDQPLRDRCVAKLSALSMRGPRGAYAYAVQSAKRLDGSPVDINRFTINRNRDTGTVTVYVASPSGPPISTDVDAVNLSIENVARPDTVTATAVAATGVANSKTLEVWATRVDGVSAAAIETLVQAKLLTFTQNYPIGGIAKTPSTQGYMYADGIEGVAKSAHPSIFDVDSDEIDIALAPGEVTTLATTVTVRIVEGGTS